MGTPDPVTAATCKLHGQPTLPHFGDRSMTAESEARQTHGFLDDAYCWMHEFYSQWAYVRVAPDADWVSREAPKANIAW